MIQQVRGTKDILPQEIFGWQRLEQVFRDVTNKYNYKEIRTPIFEKTEVFARGIGEGTDVVNKEMYTFTDRGGESITLRPENTAGLVRALIQNNLQNESAVNKLWYFGPFFRYERPQKGRLRQFHQFGAECIGSPYPESDTEIILLASDIIKTAGIRSFKLKINSLGNDESRASYKTALIQYLKQHETELSEESRNRLEINPLRILDSKDESDRKVIEDAPVILDYLDKESSEHFNEVLDSLKALDLDFEIESKLVRGLDYYNHTVFEFQSNALGAQDSFGGGGRYNKLIEELGGKSSPAIGFAFGVERLLLILESVNALGEPKNDIDIYIVSDFSKHGAETMKISQVLNRRGIITGYDLLRRSFKAKMREANKLNSKFAIIIGDPEIEGAYVTLKNLGDGSQINVDTDKLNDYNFWV